MYSSNIMGAAMHVINLTNLPNPISTLFINFGTVAHIQMEAKQFEAKHQKP